MLLDAVLDSPTIDWLATERDEIAYFTRLLGARLLRDELPHLAFGAPGKTAVRYFPDKMPIGVDPDVSGLDLAHIAGAKWRDDVRRARRVPAEACQKSVSIQTLLCRVHPAMAR